MSRLFLLPRAAATFLAVGLLAGQLLAGPPPAQAPQQAPMASPVQAPQTITKTIMVPETTYKTVTQTCTVMKPVTRQESVPYTRMVAENQTVTKLVTIQVPEQRTRT